MEDYCGAFDTPWFKANDMCCTCQGQTEAALNLSAVAGCLDSDWNVGDSWGDGCDWYAGNPEWCGSYDWADFTASELCCACTGGLSHTTECVDQDNGAGDITGDGCDWYTNYPSGCGLYNTADFDSTEMCCACGAGDHVCTDTETTDSFGDGCAWYADNTEWCGFFDDADFEASNMCCGCPSTSTLNLAMVGTHCYSYAEDTGATDWGGDNCAWYAGNDELCGVFDDHDFKANEMCCECGAGIPLSDICIELDFGQTDVTNDGCDWYENMNG